MTLAAGLTGRRDYHCRVCKKLEQHLGHPAHELPSASFLCMDEDDGNGNGSAIMAGMLWRRLRSKRWAVYYSTTRHTTGFMRSSENWPCTTTVLLLARRILI